MLAAFTACYFTGHEFIGRNIAEGAFLLSVFRMASITTDLNCEMNADGCMTVGPGVLWLAAYKEVNKTTS